MVYDPYGSFSRGLLGGLDYVSRFRQLQQDEELAPLRKEILLLNLERAKQQREEQRELPGILERVYSARYRPEVPSQDVGEMPGGAIPAGMSLSDINRRMRGAETHEEVMGAIGPQEYATLQRVAPYGLEGLRTREQQGERQREVERKQLGWNYLRAATDEMEAGRFRAAAHKLDLGLVQLGQAPKMVGLTDAIKTEEQERRYNDLAKRIGPTFRKTLEGNTEAASNLVQESLTLPQDMQAGIGKEMREAAGTVLGSKGDRKAQEGIRLYDSLLPKLKDPQKTMTELRRQRPDLYLAMEKSKALPHEFETAVKLAGQRPSAEGSVKTLDNEGIQIAHGIAAREGFSLEQRATLSAFITSSLNTAKASGMAMKPEEFEKKLRAEVARLKGIPEAALPPEEAKKVKGFWRSVMESIGLVSSAEGEAPAGRPAPGRQTASATPPPAMQTREAAMAELTRLVDLGLEQEEAEALMRRAGWGRRGAEPRTVIAP